jgi:hypothetical protein
MASAGRSAIATFPLKSGVSTIFLPFTKMNGRRNGRTVEAIFPKNINGLPALLPFLPFPPFLEEGIQ